MEEVKIHFCGPFTFNAGDRYLFRGGPANASCVYLWTIKSDLDSLYWIHYVGETNCFADRHREHLISILGLNYGIFDIAKARKGIQARIYDGLWRDNSADGPATQLKNYPMLTAEVVEYIEALEVFAAKTDVDQQTRKQIEGSIGWNLRNNHKQFKALYPDDTRVGTLRKKLGLVLRISADRPIAGLDEQLEI